MAWKLPVGVQDFAQLREGGALYADKTELIHRLCTSGWAYFLSRPRRSVALGYPGTPLWGSLGNPGDQDH